jgi:tetratricopeptide (TPR) repeat protein
MNSSPTASSRRPFFAIEKAPALMDYSCLARAAAALDDPIVIDWAVHYYSDLPPHSEARERLLSLWFSDAVLERWIEAGDFDTLSILLRELPEARWSAFAATMAARWNDWPPRMASASAKILARVAPDLATRVFGQYLENPPPWSIDRVFGILDSLDQLPLPAALPLADKLLPVNQAQKPRLSRYLSDHVFRAAVALKKTDALPDLLDHLCAQEGSRLESTVEHMAACFFAHDSYADLFLLRVKGFQSVSFHDLAALFEADTPLSEMDAILASDAPLQPALNLLEKCHVRSPGATLAWHTIQGSAAFRNAQAPTALAALVLAAVADAFERKHIDPASMPVDQVLQLLQLDVRTNIHSARLVARLQDFPRNESAASIAQRLTDHSDSYGPVHLAEAAGELAYPEFTPGLIACLSQIDGDFLCEAAQRALLRIGEPARDALIAQWELLDHSQQIYGASVLAAVGGKPVADFALAHADAMLRDDVERWCDLALGAPDQRLLERLQPELRRRQTLIDKTYYLLCRLLDANCPEIPELRIGILARRSRQKEMQENFESAIFPEQRPAMHLQLLCSACGQVNGYDVKGVAIGDPGKDKMLLADEIACLSCGAFDEFEFDAQAKMAVLAESVLLQAAAAAGNTPDPASRRILFDRVRSPEGTLQTIPAAYASLHQKLQRNPQDWRSWFRLSNIVLHINRPKAALSCLEKAHGINPLSLETIINLAQLLIDSGHKTEALDLLEGAQKDRNRWQTLPERSGAARVEFARMYNALRREFGLGHGDTAVSQVVAQAPRVGRNDPCPCGSGKKYKKCCMG